MLPAPIVSTCLFGRLKLVRLVTLNDSQRNCALARSRKVNHLLNDKLKAMKPGPSRIFRPDFPNRKALSGTIGNAVRSNQFSRVGLARPPFAIRSGRVGSPR